MSNSDKPTTYLYSLDLLRGLFAFAVMCYHVLRYEKVVSLSVLGYYCVYGFFVISGIALYLTYVDRLASIRDVRTFLLRRIFRIAPLYWLTCIGVIIILGVPKDFAVRGPLNFSLMFGFFDPGKASIVTGGWSIGIEFVFYILFPFILWAGSKRPAVMGAMAFFSIILSIWFTNKVIPDDVLNMTRDIWAAYTQPIAFIGYFLMGCFFAQIFQRYGKKWQSWKLGVLIITFSILPFLFLRTEGPVQLLHGMVGLTLMISTLTVVIGFALLPRFDDKLRAVSIEAGKLSYSVYLLHPLVYRSLQKIDGLGSVPRIGLTFFLTLIFSAIIYRIVENPVRRLGKRLTATHP